MNNASVVLETTRMNALTTAENARLLRSEGMVLNRSMNCVVVPENMGHLMLGPDAMFVPKNWARESQRSGLTPALRPDCECGGHLNAYVEDRVPTCSGCDTPTPTGTQSLRATVSMTYEPSISDHEDGFTLVIRDEPKRRGTKKSQSTRGGAIETASLFCLAAVRIRSLVDAEYRFTDSTGRYSAQPVKFCVGATPSGQMGIVAVHATQFGQLENVKLYADPLALLTGIDAPLSILKTYGEGAASSLDTTY